MLALRAGVMWAQAKDAGSHPELGQNLPGLNILLEIILKTSSHSPCLRKFLLFSNGNSMGLEG